MCMCMYDHVARVDAKLDGGDCLDRAHMYFWLLHDTHRRPGLVRVRRGRRNRVELVRHSPQCLGWSATLQLPGPLYQPNKDEIQDMLTWVIARPAVHRAHAR